MHYERDKIYSYEDENFTISYDTTSGDFDSDIEMAQKGSKYVAGKGSDRFNIDTTSGDLRIKKA